MAAVRTAWENRVCRKLSYLESSEEIGEIGAIKPSLQFQLKVFAMLIEKMLKIILFLNSGRYFERIF